jgi:uncharacterized damage-inducible protein DinB
MKQGLLDEFSETNTALFQGLSAFSDEEIDIMPSAGKWSAAQVAEHLLHSDNAILKSLKGHYREPTRDPDEKVESIKSAFLNFDLKFTAAEFLEPQKLQHQKQSLLHSLMASREEMTMILQQHDLSMTPLEEVPGLEGFSKSELLHFVLYHTQRHMHQLKNIFNSVVAHPTGQSFSNP